MGLGSARRAGRERRRARAVAVGLALAVVVAACGSRLPDDVLAGIDAQRGLGGASGPSTPRAAGGIALGDGQDAAAADLGGAAEGAGQAAGAAHPAPGDEGGGGSPGAPGDASAAGPGADPACSPAPGGGPGVTADEVKVATMVTASGPLPGATEGAFRGAAAHFAKVNAEGGVCGRRITVVKGDDGLDPQRARGEFLRLEPEVFAFVGSLAVADSGYADLVASTGVPYVGTFVDPSGREAPNVFPRTAHGIAPTGPFVYLRQQYPDVQRAAFLYADVGGVRGNTPVSREAIKRAGFEVVYDSGAQATAPDFTAEVINMQRSGAQMVYLFAFEVNMHVRLARNMRQQNFEPPLKVANIAYNSKLVELLGSIADGWRNHVEHVPVLNEDEPARSPALAEFLSWNERLFPGAQIDLFPVTAWSSSALFVEALRAVGPEVTRERLHAALEGITSFEGGGIWGRTDPSTGSTDGCFVMVVVEGGTWVREHPASGYECGLGERYRYG
jgi:branched-chain amino acid transport system substrate-binding protein